MLTLNTQYTYLYHQNMPARLLDGAHARVHAGCTAPVSGFQTSDADQCPQGMYHTTCASATPAGSCLKSPCVNASHHYAPNTRKCAPKVNCSSPGTYFVSGTNACATCSPANCNPVGSLGWLVNDDVYYAANTCVGGNDGCTQKRRSCGAGERFTAGINKEKTKDDTQCTACPNGQYTNSTTTCKAKETQSDCSGSGRFEAGKDTEKTMDDTKCTTGNYIAVGGARFFVCIRRVYQLPPWVWVPCRGMPWHVHAEAAMLPLMARACASAL